MKKEQGFDHFAAVSINNLNITMSGLMNKVQATYRSNTPTSPGSSPAHASHDPLEKHKSNSFQLQLLGWGEL